MHRYQNVVRTTFSGHTNNEEVSLTKAIYTDSNIGHTFIAGSLSPYVGSNPSFAVIELDAELYIPLSYKTYSIDINQTNT